MIIYRVKVVSTQCFKYKAKRSSSVDTSSGSVDTRDSSQKTFWPNWDSVSTLAQVVSTLEAFSEHLLGCFGTIKHNIDTCIMYGGKDHPRKRQNGPFWGRPAFLKSRQCDPPRHQEGRGRQVHHDKNTVDHAAVIPTLNSAGPTGSAERD
ncbi:hypothetical protein Taro_004716 [Colocasia esculenta]|uniref:Uncharacterized protein n=1 Tax=Colocasia esculenta TaxID=4460 RepID=A0A843TQW4_COLES|nr:hypothetical protein [Colocasia esculenta]